MRPSDAFASWQRLQLIVMNPAVLPVFCFHPIPVGGRNHNYDFSTRFQRLQIRGSVKGSGLKLGAGSFDHPFGLLSEIMNVLFQALGGGLRRGERDSFILFTL